MTDKAVFLCLLDDNKSVINKSSPQSRGFGDVLMPFFSNASIYRLAIMGLKVNLWQLLLPAHRTYLGK